MQMILLRRLLPVRWMMLAACLAIIVSLGYGTLPSIRYGLFRLGGGVITVGPYQLVIMQGWMPVETRGDSTRNTTVLWRVSPTGLIRHESRLIVTFRQANIFEEVPKMAPLQRRSWGEVVLIAPNETATSISLTPRDRGLAVFERALVIEYFSLVDLDAIRSVRRGS